MLLFSKAESVFWGYRIARSERLSELNLERIQEQINASCFDIVKLKLTVSNNKVIEQLSCVPFPTHLLNIIHLYDIALEHANYEVSNKLHFQILDETNKADFQCVSAKVYEDHYQFYYSSVVYDTLFPKDMFIRAGAEYYSSLLNSNDPSKFAFIVKFENKLAGICSFSIDKFGVGEGAFYGVLPEYRSLRFAPSILNFSKNTLFKNGAKVFQNEIVASNVKSIGALSSVGFKLKESYFNYVFFPLAGSVAESRIVLSKTSFSELVEYLKQWCKTKQIPYSDFKLIHVTGNYAALLIRENCLATFHFLNQGIIMVSLGCNGTFASLLFLMEPQRKWL